MGSPLAIELVVTTAVKVPTAVGLVPKLTVSDVVVEEVTVPIAPSLKTTVLFAAIGSNANPLITILEALIAISVVLIAIEGVTRATCEAEPLLFVFDVTTAVKFPTLVGRLVSVTVSVVAVAAETVPMAPLLRVTALLLAVVSKPNPLIKSVEALAA